MKKILLIDDDERLANLLGEYFSRYDLQLLSETQPLKGIEIIHNTPDIALVILDIMLPEIDGIEACRRIRQKSNIPILMLTARGDVMDRIVGLEMGADDYMAKPFDSRELVARIYSILKRFNDSTSPQISANKLEWNNFSIDKYTHQARFKNKDMGLTSKEFELLLLLAENLDKVYSRDKIMTALSGIDAELYSRSIDILVSRLRNKLKPLNCVQTIRGQGYRFNPPLHDA